MTNDADADGDALTASLVSGPANGTLTLNSDGTHLRTQRRLHRHRLVRLRCLRWCLTTAATVTLVVEAPIVEAGPSQTVLAGSSAAPAGQHHRATSTSFASIEWDFDYDGSTFVADPAGSGTLTPSYTWSNPGSYLVALQVTDADGYTFQGLTSVLVKPADRWWSTPVPT